MGNERRTGEPGHRNGRSGRSTGDRARGEALGGASTSPKRPSDGRSAAPIEALRVRAAVPRSAARDVGNDTRRPLSPIGPAIRAYPKNSPLWFALKIRYTPSELVRYAWSSTGSLCVCETHMDRSTEMRRSSSVYALRMKYRRGKWLVRNDEVVDWLWLEAAVRVEEVRRLVGSLL